MTSPIAVLAAFCALISAAHVSGTAADKQPGEPIVITSNSMKAAEIASEVKFIGNVTMKKGGMTLYSDSIIVFYDERSQAVREIEAVGNVVVLKEGSVAHAKRAQYFSSEEKIVLTGEARIFEHDNEIGGDRITLFMSDERSVVEGGKFMLYQEAEKDAQQKDAIKEKKPAAEGQPGSAAE